MSARNGTGVIDLRVTSLWNFDLTRRITRLVMLCYVIWLFVKRLSQEAIQRRSQRDSWLVKIKVFRLRRDADDILCNITLQSAGGESFQSAGPTTAKARFWDREVRVHGIKRSQRSAIGVNLSKTLGSSLPFSSHCLPLPSPSSFIRS